MQQARLTFSRFVDWAFLAVITMIINQGAVQIAKLTESLDVLNQKVAVAIEKLGTQDKRLSYCEDRLTALERIVWRRK